MPGAFNLDHLQPFELILSQKIFNFFTFILGSQFLLPPEEKAYNGKGNSFQFLKRMRQGGFSANKEQGLRVRMGRLLGE